MLDAYIRLIRARRIEMLCFALFSGWLLSVAFEGRTFMLYAATRSFDVAPVASITAIAFAFLGMLANGFLVKTVASAKKALPILIGCCLLATLVLLCASGSYWFAALSLAGLFSGMVVSNWGFWFLSASELEGRFLVAAMALISGNVMMLLIDLVTHAHSATAGMGASAVLLFVATVLAKRCEFATDESVHAAFEKKDLIKPLTALYVFVTIITVNSGVMYAAILPSYAHHTPLFTFYWAVPYILALLVFGNKMQPARRFGVLMLGVAMMGFALIMFSALDTSVWSFLLIDTLILGACGICDLFWWGSLAEMLDSAENPAKVFGVGLSANLFGILLGKTMVEHITRIGGPRSLATNVASAVVLVTIVSVPYLYKRLTLTQDDDGAPRPVSPILMGLVGQIEPPGDIAEQLTERELEIVSGLLNGKTYRLISEELHISQNTTKYHIKSIYTKLGVRSKTELLRLVDDRNKPPTGK